MCGAELSKEMPCQDTHIPELGGHSKSVEMRSGSNVRGHLEATWHPEKNTSTHVKLLGSKSFPYPVLAV